MKAQMLDLARSYVRRHHIGLIALFIALGGSAYAATLPRNSVGTAQLKKDAVTTAKVLNGSLLGSDFKVAQLPAGATGPQGPKGDIGPQGPKGDTGDEGPPGQDGASYIYIPDTRVRSQMFSSNLGEEKTGVVGCQGDEVPISGGYAGARENDGIEILDSAPTYSNDLAERMTGWWVRIKNNYGDSYNMTVYVVCAY